MKAAILALATLLLLSGCQSGSVVVTGTQHPAIAADQVKLYMTPPAKYEVIGFVKGTGSGSFTDQQRSDSAIAALKAQAAAVGANGVLFPSSADSQGGPAFTGDQREQHISGQAIYVTAEK